MSSEEDSIQNKYITISIVTDKVINRIKDKTYINEFDTVHLLTVGKWKEISKYLTFDFTCMIKRRVKYIVHLTQKKAFYLVVSK